MTVADGSYSVPCRLTLLTPQGRGAIATISADGIRAVELIELFFQPLGRKFLSGVPDGQLLVGYWRSTPDHVEEVVLARRSSTSVEINCHGGIAASESIIACLTGAGAVLDSGDQWLARRVTDPIQLGAWQAVSLARTDRTAGILLDQFRGALSGALREIIELLNGPLDGFERARCRIDRLLELSEVGMHLTTPWRVVLAGSPNVGKSSLVNALLGYERSIVFDQPGTTRDVLTASAALDGWPFEFADTAGYRESSDALEQEGVRRALGQVAEADLTVIVVDARQANDVNVADFRAAARQALVVANKFDLCDSTLSIPKSWLQTSAMTGSGVNQLAQQIVHKLIPVVPNPGEAVAFVEPQVRLVRAARDAIRLGDPAGATMALLQLV
jgi:tRNA modification GTPase